MQFVHTVLSVLLHVATSILTFLVTILNWCQGQISRLVDFPQANLAGVRWGIWIVAVLLILASLAFAIYHLFASLKAVLVPLWATLLAMRATLIPALSLLVGWIIGWIITAGVIAFVALLFLGLIP